MYSGKSVRQGKIGSKVKRKEGRKEAEDYK
jgi:hypothetical protein